MMVKIFTNFEFSEIPAVEVVCACGSRISIQLPRQDVASARLDCIGCGKRLWDSTEEHYKCTLGLVRSLSNWMSLSNKPFRLECSILDKN